MSSIMGLPADDLLKPPGFDAPITPIDGCCADKCKAFLDGSYRRGCKDTVDKVLEILSRYRLRHYNGKTHKSVGAEIKAEVEALKRGEQE